jgi:hypothetical protein
MRPDFMPDHGSNPIGNAAAQRDAASGVLGVSVVYNVVTAGKDIRGHRSLEPSLSSSLDLVQAQLTGNRRATPRFVDSDLTE